MATKPTTPKTPKAGAKPRRTASKTDGAQPADGMAKAGGTTELRAKDLMDRVVTSTGLQRKDVKTVVEAALTMIGESLKAGESLNLPGLGKMRVARGAAGEGGAMTLKLRQGGGAEKGKKAVEAPLADDEDQD